MQAIFCGRRRNRIVVETGDGYVAAEAIDDCEFVVGEAVSGVQQDHGSQHWSGAGGSSCEVYVEAFDASHSWVSNWINAG